MIVFSVLGPLRLHRGADELRLGAPKQRALLIRLLLDHGRTVPTDVLVEDLWAGTAPPSAVRTLQSYVAHLRRSLGEDAGLIRSDAGRGYAIDLTGAGLDSDIAAQRWQDGQRLLAVGEADGAVELFESALSLWQGAPLSDVAYEEFARGRIAELTELRANLVEARAVGLLALDRAPEAIAALEAHVADHPLREGPHGHLMVALYRTGRISDALDVFRRFEDRLADELGLDPTPAIVAVRDAVLRHEPVLAVGVATSSAAEQSGAAAATAVSGGLASTLPRLLHEVIGREDDRGRVIEFLETSRLVTLVGPGGVGKTTLATAAAQDIAEDQPDDVWFVPLADERDGSRVTGAIGEAIGLAGDAATIAAVIARLRDRRALLLVDNCEHMTDAVASVVEHVLRSTTHLRVLATSREALGIRGEVQLVVSPLAGDDAVELFMQRAQAVRPELDLTPYERDVAAICERLDGMPLAVELAAARVGAITPTAIAARLDDRFGLLNTGSRTAATRHRTLRDVIDWSHDLLSDDEQALFRRLAVFVGGWTLGAAEQVCDLEGRGDGLDRLARLVGQSLVVARDDRFSMLESIHVYATERLAATREGAELRKRHASWMTDLATELAPALRGAGQAQALAVLAAEDHNLRAALAWSREHAVAEPELGLGLAAALGWYWYVGRQVDGRAELAAVLQAVEAVGEVPDSARAAALEAHSLALRPGGCIVHPHPEAAVSAQTAAGLFAAAGATADAARCSLLAAVEGVAPGDPADALAAIGAARHELAAAGDAWSSSLADFVEMEIRLHHGEPAAALVLGRRAAAGFDALDDAWGRSAVRLHLGIGLRATGADAEALVVLEEAVRLSRRTGLANNLARSLLEVAVTALQRGRRALAEDVLSEAALLIDELADELLMSLLAATREELDRRLREPVERHGPDRRTSVGTATRL